jgi:membrane associated rhomboid family serine protease
MNMSLSQTPVAVLILISTVALSLYTIYKNRELYEKLLLHPYSVVKLRKWYQMLTSGFVHADMMHLIFNMLTFYFFASALEITIGSVDFAIIYLGSLVLANVSTVMKQADNPNYKAVGASGAISGVLFATILYYPDMNVYLYFAIGIPAPLFGILYLVYCHFASKHANDFINHEAHFWGAAAGLAITILLNPSVVPYFFSRIF